MEGWLWRNHSVPKSPATDRKRPASGERDNSRWGVRASPVAMGRSISSKVVDDVSFAVITRILLGIRPSQRFRFAGRPETFDEIQQFVAGLTQRDLAPPNHRLHLVAQNDPAPWRAKFSVPLYGLSGLFDPVVPWFWVRRWLRGNCPGLKGYRIIWLADHNVLGTSPDVAAEQIRTWMGLEQRSKARS